MMFSSVLQVDLLHTHDKTKFQFKKIQFINLFSILPSPCIYMGVRVYILNVIGISSHTYHKSSLPS